MAANGKLTRDLPGVDDFFGQPDLRFKPLVIAIDEGDERNRHIKNARQPFCDAIENFFRCGIGQTQTSQFLDAFFLVFWNHAGDYLIGKGNTKFPSCTTASASDTTTSFAPEDRSRSPAPAMFSVAPQIPTTIFTCGN
jgi:hypothetical protein